MNSSARRSRSLPPLVLLAGIALLAALASGPSAAAKSQTRLTVWAVPTGAHFTDHSDDRTRGVGNNPFNVDTKALEQATTKKEAGHGPFPGDGATYSFKLYKSSTLKKRIGSAVITCLYNFHQRANCDALFTLSNGTLFASGPVDFNSSTFMLAVTGGTVKYLGAGGQVAAAPARKSQRLDFVLG